MNVKKIKDYIQLYKDNFDAVSKLELYKWEAVKIFEENWDIEASDFYMMLENSLRGTNNLLASGSYLPRAVLLEFAQAFPEEVRNSFKLIYDESIPLEDRFVQFKEIMESLRTKMEGKANHYQDHRAFVVYLSLRYPNDYFLYKFKMFNEAVDLFEYSTRPTKGSFSNIFKFYDFCEIIKGYLIEDNALLRLHHNRLNINTYQDPSYHLLTQDFIYACVAHLNFKEEKRSAKQDSIEINVSEFSLTDYQLALNEPNFDGRNVDYVEKSKNNSRIGQLAEQFVVSYEKNRLAPLGLEDKVEHISVAEGDGKGYDIKSVDEEGNTIYIEVKATSGKFDTPFYITRNELAWSNKTSKSYKLYRVYNFNTKTGTGEIKIFSGSLSELAQTPVNYLVNLKRLN